jgi:hypothetical protein
VEGALKKGTSYASLRCFLWLPPVTANELLKLLYFRLLFYRL